MSFQEYKRGTKFLKGLHILDGARFQMTSLMQLGREVNLVIIQEGRIGNHNEWNIFSQNIQNCTRSCRPYEQDYFPAKVDIHTCMAN